jgi:hypothetical protein
MPKRIYVGMEIEGFSKPVGAYVEFEGFDDPIIALEKMKVFEVPVFMKVRIKEAGGKTLEVRTNPAR